MTRALTSQALWNPSGDVAKSPLDRRVERVQLGQARFQVGDAQAQQGNDHFIRTQHVGRLVQRYRRQAGRTLIVQRIHDGLVVADGDQAVATRASQRVL